MHKLIRLCIWAEDEDQAHGKAKWLMDGGDSPLMMPRGPYDYGRLLSDSGARWRDEYPEFTDTAVRPITDPEAVEALHTGWEYQREFFFENLQKVREILDELDDETIYNDELVELGDGRRAFPRHVMHNLGAYKGGDLYVYDEDGAAIRTHDEMTWLFGRDHEGQELYVGLADVHY